MPMTHRRVAACLFGAALIAIQAQAEESARRFAIAADSAGVALPEFARQAGMDVLANGDILRGVRTNAIEGELTPSAALKRLLEGTGLTARRSPMGTMLVEAPPPARREDLAQVLIVGTRASEESSIRRKRFADTATDAIVADDVASFPDNNVAEAVSRIAGVALERGDFGEGNFVSVRGNGPEAIRVEMDGMAVLAGGGTDLNGGGEGRGVELRELPADLIASVDVVKGSTADMTEGGIGGSILIRTRTGLDFKKRSFSIRTAAQANSLSRTWTPNLNVFFADRLLGGRLGVVANLTRSKAHNEQHLMQIGANNTGYLREVDFDQSPDKTFALNPAALAAFDPLAHQPIASYPMRGGGRLSTMTPLQIVTLSAAALTKEACRQAFPVYSEAELAPLGTGDRAAAQNARSGELRSCLGQWNDYLPGVTRYFVKTQVDERSNADLRLDYKVGPRLALYAKVNRSRRDIADTINALSLGSPSVSTGNIAPGSVLVDASHHVTALDLSAASVSNDVIATTIGTSAGTAQFGASWRADGWRADLLVGRTSSDFSRYGLRSNLSFGYGAVHMRATPDGLWAYDFAGANPIGQMRDIGKYGVLTPNADPRLPARGPLTQLTFDNPKAGTSTENNLRLDLAYAPGSQVPLLERLRFGLNRRVYANTSWGGGGYTVASGANGTAATVMPALAVRSALQACQDGTASGACQYGVAYSSNPATRFDSTITLTQQAYRALVAATLSRQTASFFRGAAQAPEGVDGWTMYDAAGAFQLSGVQYMNLDCIRSCLGSDGQRYEQPRSELNERIAAGYLSAEFGLDAGVELTGNLGWRYVRTGVAGTGLMAFQTISKGQDGATTSLTTAHNTTLARRSTDFMPVLNLAAAMLDDRLVLRYHLAKAIARPGLSYLIPNNVTCTHDDTLAPAAVSCTGTMGNPGLRAHTSRNQNLSLEWYPDRASLLSLSLFRQAGILGAPRRVLVDGQSPVDALPATYVTWTEGLPSTRTGFELAARTAFSALPAGR